MAPEVIMQEYGALCDEWSVGEPLLSLKNDSGGGWRGV